MLMKPVLMAFTAIAMARADGETGALAFGRESILVRPLTPSGPSDTKEVNLFPLGEARAIVVTNLRSAGAGSLRAAIDGKGPRLIVFEVGGVIDLGGQDLQVREALAFIAGETAPDPGITIIRGSLVIETDHVIVRHLAVRPGDGRPSPSLAWQPDGIAVSRQRTPVHDVLIQNCSATWAVDENLSVSGPADTRPAAGPDATAHDVTLRNNLIAEGLLNSTHAKGPHSMGTLIHDGIAGILVQGNLFAHNRERNPRLKGGVKAVIQGNVIYNWGSAAIGVGSKGDRETLDGVEAVIANNVAIAGPNTTSPVLVRAVDPGAHVLSVNNLAVDAAGRAIQKLDGGITATSALPAWASAARLRDSSPNAVATLAAVLKRAGARPARRDPIDQRIVAAVIEGSGRIIDSQSEVGGYPARAEARREVKVPDGDGARRAWLGALMGALDSDEALDVGPLLKRLKIAH